MKLKKTIFYLLLSVIFSCTSSDIEEKTSTEETSTEETSTLYVTDEVTGEFLKEVLDNLKISDLSYNYNNETSNKTSNRGIAIECNHAIEDRTENKDYDFDLTRDYLNNPLSDSEIQDLINAPINSTTESSIKYFSSNGAPTTDCDTEEFEAPILNYDARDGLLRPIAFTYSNIFDYYGEHHFANVYRIKRTEKTTFRGASIPSIVLNTEGVVEKRVDRYHQVHAYTSKDQIYKEDLNLSGYIQYNNIFSNHFVKPNFEFLPGSKRYYETKFSSSDELGDNDLDYNDLDYDGISDDVDEDLNPAVIENNINQLTGNEVSLKKIDTYVVRFYVLVRHGKIEYKVPIVFIITIDLDEVIAAFEEQQTGSYSKRVELYIRNSSINERIGGDVTYVINGDGEHWTTRNIKVDLNSLDLSSLEITNIAN